jgi:hypothetical protein
MTQPRTRTGWRFVELAQANGIDRDEAIRTVLEIEAESKRLAPSPAEFAAMTDAQFVAFLDRIGVRRSGYLQAFIDFTPWEDDDTCHYCGTGRSQAHSACLWESARSALLRSAL